MVQITEQLVRKKSEHNECLISTLEELSLHQENIERIDNLHNWCRNLKILLLQSNLISKIENLHKLKRLEYLNLAINNIECVENLERLESLNKLDLTLNFIGELTSLECLRDNYNLRELLLIGNPCCDYPHYREYVVATLPQLTQLDCVEITCTAKLEAQRQLKSYRAEIVQNQADYVMQRDEQKLRVQRHQLALADEMEQIEDESERMKKFWQAESEHCPESRNEIAKYQKQCRDEHKSSTSNRSGSDVHMKLRRQPLLFAPCGRPYNLNQAKLPFNFQDELHEYILQLNIYRYLETQHIDVDVETRYVRVTVKGKIFQLAFNDEVQPSESHVQRSQITGQMLIKMPKLRRHGDLLEPCNLGVRINKPTIASIGGMGQQRKPIGLQGTVDTRCICEPQTVPDLI